MKKYIQLFLFVSVSIIAVSCGEKEETMVQESKPAIQVRTEKAILNGANAVLTLSGTVQATHQANLSTRMMGFVDEVYVALGEKVQKGQLLMTINKMDLLAKLAQVDAGIKKATVGFESAERDYMRFKNLYNERSASLKELEDMTARFEMAKAGLESANQMREEINAQFEYADIKAPFTGVISQKYIRKGDMANPGMHLMTMESQNEFEVIAQVPESEIVNIHKGTEVTVLLKSVAKTIKGKVTQVSTSASNTGGQYLVKVALKEKPEAIRSGMYASVQVPVKEEKFNSEMVLIEKSALIERGQLSGVYTVGHNNTALLRWLRLGKSFGEKVEVLSGLSVNEIYILSAGGKLSNGSKIIIQ